MAGKGNTKKRRGKNDSRGDKDILQTVDTEKTVEEKEPKRRICINCIGFEVAGRTSRGSCYMTPDIVVRGCNDPACIYYKELD